MGRYAGCAEARPPRPPPQYSAVLAVLALVRKRLHGERRTPTPLRLQPRSLGLAFRDASRPLRSARGVAPRGAVRAAAAATARPECVLSNQGGWI